MTKRALAVFALCVSLMIAPALSTKSVAATKDATKSGSAKTTESAVARSDKEIADAKTKGMVWVNTSTGVYHRKAACTGRLSKANS